MRTPGQGITFREAMTGRLTFGATDPVTGAEDVAAVPFVLRATIDIPDMAGFVAEPTHTGGLAGHLYAPRAGFTLPSTSGIFRLFSPGTDPVMTEMVYEMGYMRDGKPYYFRGRKTVRIGSILRAWRETTTLYVTLHEGNAAGTIVGAGILRLNLFDFLALMGNLRAVGSERPLQRLRTVMRFAGFFARELWRTYVVQKASAMTDTQGAGPRPAGSRNIDNPPRDQGRLVRREAAIRHRSKDAYLDNRRIDVRAARGHGRARSTPSRCSATRSRLR